MNKLVNVVKYLEEHRHELSPPANNVAVYKDGELCVTLMLGPNLRTPADFHVNASEEFVYQVKGEMHLSLFQHGRIDEHIIREGEMFLIPSNVPHAIARPAGTMGIGLQRHRRPDEKDGLVFVCRNCVREIYSEYFSYADITKDMQPVIAKFYGDPKLCTCPKCGQQVKPAK